MQYVDKQVNTVDKSSLLTRMAKALCRSIVPAVAALAIVAGLSILPRGAEAAVLFAQTGYGSSMWTANGCSSHGTSANVTGIGSIQVAVYKDTGASGTVYVDAYSGGSLTTSPTNGFNTSFSASALPDGLNFVTINPVYAYSQGTTPASLTAGALYIGCGNSSGIHILGNGSEPYLILDSSTGGITPADTSTRFISTTPLNEAVVSSTTPVTVGAEIYMNSADYASGQYLSITFTNDTVAALGGSALDAWNAAWGTGSTGGFPEIKIPITSAGDLSLSTTTSNFVRDGRVHATYAVKSPTFWSSLWGIGTLFSGDTVMSTTTSFVVGEKTDFDIASDNGGAGLANTILFGTTTAGISTSTVEAITSACLPLTGNFNLFGCLKGLIIPDSATLQSAFTQARDGFLSYFPFGYVTRFYTIISGTATSSLPNLAVTIPSGFPASGDTINLTPWGHLMGQGSYLATATSTQDGVTFESSFETYWDDFVYFVFGVGVVLRLVGMNSTLTFGFGNKKEAQAVQNKKQKR